MSPQDQARHWMNEGAVILDTETTGLDEEAEACEISVISMDGKVLFNEVIKPSIPIGRSAMGVHGIRNMDIKNRPSIQAVAHKLRHILDDRILVTYNAEFDRRIIERTFAVAQLEPPRPRRWDCAMLAYAEWMGVSGNKGKWKWHKLTDALERHSLAYMEPAHRAKSDCFATRQLVFLMAGATEKLKNNVTVNLGEHKASGGVGGSASPLSGHHADDYVSPVARQPSFIDIEPDKAGRHARLDKAPSGPRPNELDKKIGGYPKGEWVAAGVILIVLLFLLLR